VHAQPWAALTHREVPQLLTEALALVLTPIGTPPADAPPVATLSDTEVLALAQVQMAPKQGHRLNQLLAKQEEVILTTQEQAELLALMQVYQQLWVRQSEALVALSLNNLVAVTVRRNWVIAGWRPPPV
jgi:hypothetical protein